MISRWNDRRCPGVRKRYSRKTSQQGRVIALRTRNGKAIERYGRSGKRNLGIISAVVVAKYVFSDASVSTISSRGFRDLGYKDLSLCDFVRLRDHGVSAGFARQLRSSNGSLVSVQDLIRRRDRG